MNNRIFIASLSLLLFGCKSTLYRASQEEINNYFDNQVVRLLAKEVEHKDYGKIPAESKSYRIEHYKCQQESFSGQSFKFGNLEVSDPRKLAQFSFDYIKKYTAFSFSNDKKLSKYVGVYEQNMFDDKVLTSNVDAINALSSKTLDCLTAKGWSRF